MNNKFENNSIFSKSGQKLFELDIYLPEDENNDKDAVFKGRQNLCINDGRNYFFKRQSLYLL